VRSGKSVGDENGWLQADGFWLSSRAAITGEKLPRFPTHLVGEWAGRLYLQPESSVVDLDCTLRDILVYCPVPSVRFVDWVEYCSDVVGDHPAVVRRTM